MVEYIRHIFGLCGENHGFIYLLYSFGAFIFTMIKIAYMQFKWWIQETIITQGKNNGHTNPQSSKPA